MIKYLLFTFYFILVYFNQITLRSCYIYNYIFALSLIFLEMIYNSIYIYIYI
ncbi:hypothetical protein BJ944DRAFT_269657 [Cunninghamella echinulata]|nr:hypothetical protein BJ944DRAFT_269657 [Cunninghamella echinulata]